MKFHLVIIVILAVSQYAHCNFTEVPEISDSFAEDWIIKGKDAVVYSRDFNEHREFSYTSCETSEDYCNVTLVSAKPSDSTSKTCKFNLDRSQTPEIGVSSLYLSENEEMKNRVVVEWYRKANDHFDPFISILNTADCQRSIDRFAGSIYNYRQPPHVIMYSNGLLTVSETRKNRRIIRNLSFENKLVDRQKHGKYLQVNHMWTGEEQPVEIGSSQGFFFIATNGDSDRKIDVMYANLSTEDVKVLGTIERNSGHIYSKTSGSNDKYGLCWKSFQKDNRVNCTQFDIDGHRSMDSMSLELSEPIDWFAIHNLKEPAMLLITGQCNFKKCKKFSVTKVDVNNGKKSRTFKIPNLNAECAEAPFSLSMDVVEDLKNKLICFNFVCLNNKYKDQSVEKTSTTVQYRRSCVNEDYIIKMN